MKPRCPVVLRERKPVLAILASIDPQVYPVSTTIDERARLPIGIFDSGLGGLSVLRSIRESLPGEDLVYLADSAYCPYGSKQSGQILDRSKAVAAALIERGIKLLVVACNTACAVALDVLRGAFALPIVGLEPAIKPAVQLTQTGRIAVLATPRTIASERLAKLIDRYAAGITVERIAVDGWVELVESGLEASEEAVASLTSVVLPALATGADVLVLGCTHFPFLAPAIRDIAGDNVQIVESGQAIARRTADQLDQFGLRNTIQGKSGRLELLTTSATPAIVGEMASRLLGYKVSAAPALI